MKTVNDRRPLATRRQTSRAQDVYDYLRDLILSGKLGPDERLVEDQIARQAHVSRTPVREAIRRLEAEGIVRQTRLGIVVVEISATELREFCQVREFLEGMACRLAAESRSQLELATLERIGEDYEQALHDDRSAEIMSLNRAFHERIWLMANNSYLMSELADLRSRIDGLRPTSTLTTPARHRVAIAEHREMLNAVHAHDGEKAERVAREHFRKAMARRLGEASLTADGIRMSRALALSGPPRGPQT